MATSRTTERIYKLQHNEPPAVVIHKALDAYLDKIEPTGTDLLVAVYVRPTTKMVLGAGGKMVEIDISQGSQVVEDKYQGKVCLVLKSGPNTEEAAKYFKDGRVPKPGDWVLIPVYDRSVQFLMGLEEDTRHVAIVPAHKVAAVLSDPDCFL